MGQVAQLSLSGIAYDVYADTTDPLTDSNTYFKAHIDFDLWDALSSTVKKRSIITARRMLDRSTAWSGTKTVSTQANEWPRDAATCSGDLLADAIVPDRLVDGEFELALVLSQDSSVYSSRGAGSNTKRVKAGSAEVEFFSPTIDTNADTRFPQVVHDLMWCYTAGAAGLVPGVSYGTTDAEGVSSFTDCDQHDRNQGFA